MPPGYTRRLSSVRERIADFFGDSASLFGACATRPGTQGPPRDTARRPHRRSQAQGEGAAAADTTKGPSREGPFVVHRLLPRDQPGKGVLDGGCWSCVGCRTRGGRPKLYWKVTCSPRELKVRSVSWITLSSPANTRKRFPWNGSE